MMVALNSSNCTGWSTFRLRIIQRKTSVSFSTRSAVNSTSKSKVLPPGMEIGKSTVDTQLQPDSIPSRKMGSAVRFFSRYIPALLAIMYERHADQSPLFYHDKNLNQEKKEKKEKKRKKFGMMGENSCVMCKNMSRNGETAGYFRFSQLRFVVAAVLLIAAGLKAYQLATAPLGNNSTSLFVEKQSAFRSFSSPFFSSVKG